MQSFFKNILRVTLISFFSIPASSFEVKVLLNKDEIVDCVKDPINIVSSQGFVLSRHAKLSVGYEYAGHSLTLTSKNQKLLINGKPLEEKLLHISTMLSGAHQAKLKSNISCFLETSKQDLIIMAQPLHPLFDQLVASDGQVTSEACIEVGEYVQDICLIYLNHALPEGLNSSKVLRDYCIEFLKNNPQKIFIERLAQKHLTSEHQKILTKDKKKRYAFFAEELFSILDEMVCGCVCALPRKIISQILGAQVGFLEYDGNKYLGNFIIFQDKKHVFVINSLDIDDYLLSVVRHEGFPGWPMEMNKVMAVACRSYLVCQVMEAQKVDRPYHIQNGIKHQTYKGYHECSKIKQAIDETKDLLVSFGGKPALTMYDSCCGGIVPGNIDDPGYKRVSYLARMYPCTFCKGYKVFHWSINFTAEEVLKRLQKEFSKLEKISEVHVHKKDKAGLVKKIMIIAGPRKIIITEKKMKSLFPELRSYCFDITKAHKRFMIEGRGFGHHRGLCQYGAFHLVKEEHWNFAEVLQFYYPGTDLIKLTYQR